MVVRSAAERRITVTLRTARTNARRIALRRVKQQTMRHPKMELLGEFGGRIVLPYAPLPVDHDNIARKWETIDRTGRQPLLVAGALPLRTVSFTLLLARPDHQQPVEDWINRLRNAARTTYRYGLSYGPFEQGMWRITGLRISITNRQHGTNLATRATAQMTLTEAGPAIKVGPLTGGVRPPTPAPPPERSPWPVLYHVKRGHTLWALAVRFYKDGRKWPIIADRNGIRDPRKMPTYQQSGKHLVIPYPHTRPDLKGRPPGHPQYGAD